MSEDLRFECQPGCTRCCEQAGFVYLAETDVPRIAAFLDMTPTDFERKYLYRTRNFIRLRTPKVGRCTFLAAGGCSIHEVKPMQCRSFPFWPELLESKKEWGKTASWCPGIGKGELVTIQAANATAAEAAGARSLLWNLGEPMNRRRFGTALGAVVAGLSAGAAMAVAADDKKPAPKKSKAEKHECKGQNSCKGKGGCSSGDNGCAGKNSCKGKGGCAVA